VCGARRSSSGSAIADELKSEQSPNPAFQYRRANSRTRGVELPSLYVSARNRRSCPPQDGMRLAGGVASPRARQTDGKLAALSKASTRRFYASSVRLYEIAHECQADAQSRARAVIRFIRLPEQIEYAW
jgi:hypothetical protein